MDDSQNDELKRLSVEQETIFNSVPAWIFYKDRENRFIRVNKAFCQSMGKTRAELEGKSLFDLFPKDQAENYWKDDKEIMQTGKAKTGIVETAETAKGIKWLETDKIPYFDVTGKIIGIIGFSVDITDRKIAEDAIKKSQLMLQRIIDLLPIRIFWKDIKLIYLGCNKVFAKDAGKASAEEVIGLDDFHMGWKDQAEAYRKDDMQVIKSQMPKFDYEEEQTSPTGDKLWLMTNKVVLKDVNGQTEGVLGTYLDITERKLAEIELKNALDVAKKANEFMVNRELKMIELKNKIIELENQLNSVHH